MATEKHIEVFPGSLSDLERMTGQRFMYMLFPGYSAFPEGPDDPPSGISKIVVGRALKEEDLENSIREEAEKFGADAVVNVIYREFAHPDRYRAAGSLVKLKP
ncbi:MAG: hypothetical protein Q8R18_05305 [bacterium]|nr:hypothetical protein [bacterium]